MKFTVCIILSCLFLVGCVDLAVNDGKNKHVDVKRLSHVKGEIYTMRGGLGGIFSKGMNQLEDTLENDYHIFATSTVWYKGQSLSHHIIHNYRMHKKHGPIILVGHSLGANEQIQVAKDLNRAHIPVSLLVTVDAVLPTSVPPNVLRVYNIYKPAHIPLFSGLIVKVDDPKRTKIENRDVTDMAINHFTIDGNERVQKMMLKQILSALNKDKMKCAPTP
jgi:hypothetical protein